MKSKEDVGSSPFGSLKLMFQLGASTVTAFILYFQVIRVDVLQDWCKSEIEMPSPFMPLRRSTSSFPFLVFFPLHHHLPLYSLLFALKNSLLCYSFIQFGSTPNYTIPIKVGVIPLFPVSFQAKTKWK